jgi:phage/plasmid-associated DNA primase
MLNAVNDINASKIENSGALKRILSGERLKMERKHRDPHFDEPNAKHLYTANWLPRVVGQDESLYRRVLIVEFPNQVPDKKRNENLKNQLRQPEVLSAILNEALDARDRLHEQGGFTNDRSREDTRRKWDSWRDAHKRFLYTQFEITGDSNDYVEKDDYYKGYKEYANRKGYELRAKQSVTKSLKYTPEVGVTEEHYTGLVWQDRDAANKDTFSVAQDEAVQKVSAAIQLRCSGDELADKKEVIAALAENIGAERVQNTIEKLKKNGSIQEPIDGKLELT